MRTQEISRGCRSGFMKGECRRYYHLQPVSPLLSLVSPFPMLAVLLLLAGSNIARSVRDLILAISPGPSPCSDSMLCLRKHFTPKPPHHKLIHISRTLCTTTHTSPRND